MKFICKPILPLMILIMSLVWMSMSYAAMVTVDAVSKTAKSDVTTLDLSSVRVQGDQIGIFVKNTIPEPQIFILKVNGLKDQNYDIYINHESKGSKSTKDLEAGVEYRVDGRVTDPDMLRCLIAVKDTAGKAYNRMRKLPDSEAQRIANTLSQAKGWAQSSLQRDQAFRSISVILAPAGGMVQPMQWLTREGDYETARAVTRACWLLQQARAQMYRVIHNPVLRNEAVLAMTPVEFTALYSTLNGKPHVTAKLTNNCNLPVSGAISMTLPKGWKTTAKRLGFNDLKSGETFSLSFDLISPSKKATPPDSVPVVASITVTQDDMTAGMKLSTTAGKVAK